MNPPTDRPGPPAHDPLAAYVEGVREAVDTVRPDEPTEGRWDAACRSIQARLNSAPAPARPRTNWRMAMAGGAAFAAVAAAVTWLAFLPVPAQDNASVTRPGPHVADGPADPLAEFGVLPVARTDEVDLRRVPGTGWLPVGGDPLPDVLALATPGEVELDDPDPTWPQVTPSPGDAPMIFAAKPR